MTESYKAPTYEDYIQQPIPLDLPSVAGWKEVPIKKKLLNEPLVALGPFSDNDHIFTDSLYFGEMNNSPYMDNLPVGSLITMFVRKSVARQLAQAQKLLPENFHLVVFDAYRSVEVQGSLFNKYFSDLRQQKPDWTEEQLLDETQKYVSLPSTDSTKPSPHNTGGAVDLAIFKLPRNVIEEINRLKLKIKQIDRQFWKKRRLLAKYPFEMRSLALIRKHAQLLEFGTPFDWGGEEAGLNYFERQAEVRTLTEIEQEARGNRRLLYHVMISVGMQPYADEWWHYNSPKSQMGAKVAGLSYATFGPMHLSEGNQQHEQMRKNHRTGTIKLARSQQGKLGLVSSSRVLNVAYQAAQETGDPRITSLPEAAIIGPTG